MSDLPGSGVSERWVEWRRTVDLEKYDQRWQAMEARGEPVHGEADAVMRLIDKYLAPNQRCAILDAGCGTGRLAVELERRGHGTRGHNVTGIDLDPDMIERARSKSSTIEWLVGDLSTITFGGKHEDFHHNMFDHNMFHVIVMAGNIVNFCAPGTQSAIVRNMVRHLHDGGLLVCGWSQELRDDAYRWDAFVRDARDVGANLAESWTNWDGDSMPASTLGGEPLRSSDYAVITVIKSS
ncbi:MAG: class I SAM-dependent methyltransferase [Actinomycetota bacterium]